MNTVSGCQANGVPAEINTNELTEDVENGKGNKNLSMMYNVIASLPMLNCIEFLDFDEDNRELLKEESDDARDKKVNYARKSD